MGILVRIMERQLIGNYDPALASFWTFLRAFVLSEVRRYEKAQERRDAREWLGGTGPPPDELGYADVEYALQLQQVGNPVLVACSQIVAESGKVTGKALAPRLGVSLQAAQRRLRRLDEDEVRRQLYGLEDERDHAAMP